MRYLVLIHGDSEAEAALSEDERIAIVREHMSHGAMLRERGAHRAARRSRVRIERPSAAPGPSPAVTDGPFAETKEAIGGFYLVDVATREEAIELAGRVPVSPGVAVEVLPCVEF